MIWRSLFQQLQENTFIINLKKELFLSHQWNKIIIMERFKINVKKLLNYDVINKFKFYKKRRNHYAIIKL